MQSCKTIGRMLCRLVSGQEISGSNYNGAPVAYGTNRTVGAFAIAFTPCSNSRNRDLASRYGKALGEEFVGKDSNSILGPMINTMSTWHWERNGETYSEDPYLTAFTVSSK
jgi:beta-glucosidase